MLEHHLLQWLPHGWATAGSPWGGAFECSWLLLWGEYFRRGAGVGLSGALVPLTKHCNAVMPGWWPSAVLLGAWTLLSSQEQSLAGEALRADTRGSSHHAWDTSVPEPVTSHTFNAKKLFSKAVCAFTADICGCENNTLTSPKPMHASCLNYLFLQFGGAQHRTNCCPA